jgi:hypothetical protein
MTRPLFVVGCHRSGTTVMRRILNTHPSVWLAKETQYLAFLQLKPGDWHAARAQGELREHVRWLLPFLRATGWSRVPDPGALPEQVTSWAGVYRWVCELERPQDRALAYWGDNTPRYVSLVPELDRAFPDARYIHLVRDPRDVVRSAMEVWFGGNTALTAAEEWLERVGAGLAAGQLVGERMYLLRFEDLLLDPQGTLGKLARFLDLPALFDPSHTGGDSGSLAREQHLAKLTSPLDPKVIGRYRQSLSAREIAEIEQLCQPFLRSFGYESETWHPSWNPTHRFARYTGHYARSLGINLARGLRRRLPWG